VEKTEVATNFYANYPKIKILAIILFLLWKKELIMEQEATQTPPKKSCNYIECLGVILIRLSLVIVLLWIGAMKFTSYEANAIQGLISTSPIMSWTYQVFSVQMTSNIIGIIEIITAILLLIGFKCNKMGGLGAILAIITFAITTTFIFTVPGWEQTLGFPALSVSPGQFLLKDIVLFSAAVLLLGRACRKC